MKVFNHHIYEYKKGLRNLILHTTKASDKKEIERRLEDYKIPYLIYHVNSEKINVFFGNQNCINVIDKINKNDLREYSDEEDFILGIMLGYDRVDQCKRFIERKLRKEAIQKRQKNIFCA
ncbi:MAG: DUF2023 family protein [Halothermotrichaceae bacterium]